MYIALVVPTGVEADTITTEAAARAAVDEASTFWSSQTDGKVTFVTAQVLPAYQSAFGCVEYGSLWNEAVGLMPDSVGPNNHLLVLTPSTRSNPVCYQGLGTVGLSVNEGGMSLISELKSQVIAHELGHNMGNLHSNSLLCDNAQDGAYAAGVFAGCTAPDYDDMFDIMGFSAVADLTHGVGNLNAVHLDGMGFDPAQIRRIPVNSGTTTVTIPPLSALATGERVVKIADISGEDYFVEYRTNSGRDAYAGIFWPTNPGWGVRVLRSNPDNGFKDSMASYIMDATPPPTATQDYNKAIPVGGTFTSASTRLTIKVTGQTAAGATLSITNGATPVPTAASMNMPSSATIGQQIIISTLVTDQFGGPLLGWPVSLQKMQKGTTTWQSAMPAGWPTFNTDTSTGMLAISSQAGLSGSYRWVVQSVSGSVVKYSPATVFTATAVVTGVPPVTTLARRKSLTVTATIPTVPSPVVYLQYRYGTSSWITGPRASVNGNTVTAKMTANSSGTLSTRMYLKSGTAYVGSYGAVFTTVVK